MKGADADMALRSRRLTMIFILLLCTVLLTGCGSGGSIYSNYHALEELETVSTLGLDRNLSGVTLSAAADRGGEAESPVLLRQTAPDLRLGMEALQDCAGERQLFFAHTRYLVLGEDWAADGIGALLDYVERDVSTRMGAELFILRGDRAETLVTGSGNIAAVLNAAVRNAEHDGSSAVSSLHSVAVALSEYGAAAVCALRAEPTAGSTRSEAPEYTAVPDGYAILKNGALTGFVSGAEAEALGFLAKSPGTVIRRCTDGNGSSVVLELQRRGAPEFRLSQTEEGLRFDVSLKLNAVISAVDTVTQAAELPDERELCRRAAAEVTEDAARVLAQLQSLDADVFGLGAAVRRECGSAQSFLKDAAFYVKTEVTMDHSYDMTEPLGMAGGSR